MPPRKELSPEDIREIVAARGTLTAKEIQKKFGIGTTRLYRIWREAGVVPGKTSKTAETTPATAAIPPVNPATVAVPPATVAVPPAAVEIILLQQILPLLQEMRNEISILMETQESHYEDTEEIGEGLQGLEAEVEDTGEGILDSIEKNSNAVRAQTDKIVGTTNALVSAVLGVLKVLGIGLGVASALWLLSPIARPKLEEWKQKYAASEEGEQQNTANEEMDKPPQQPVVQQKRGIRRMD